MTPDERDLLTIAASAEYLVTPVSRGKGHEFDTALELKRNGLLVVGPEGSWTADRAHFRITAAGRAALQAARDRAEET